MHKSSIICHGQPAAAIQGHYGNLARSNRKRKGSVNLAGPFYILSPERSTANKISALMMVSGGHEMGNGGFVSAEQSIREYLGSCELSEMEVFLREFRP